MSETRKCRRLYVVVGKPWTEEVDVYVAPAPRPLVPDPKSHLALYLASWACFLLAAFSAYGMVMGNGEILARVFKLVETMIAFLGGWIGGRSQSS